MSSDHDQLRLLSIFHFIFAGFAALFALLPILYLAFGILLASGVLPGESGHDPAAPIVGGILAGLGGLFLVLGLTFVVLQVLAGRSLLQRRRYTLCVVVAALECLSIPFGTVLGILTLVVLTRPRVKAMFGLALDPVGSAA